MNNALKLILSYLEMLKKLSFYFVVKNLYLNSHIV